MKINLYYTPPNDDIFEEVKKCSIKIWQRYDNQFGYVDEKVNKIKNLENIKDNFMYMVAIFDMNNQSLLANILSDEAKKEIRDRMVAGGQPEKYIVF